MKIIGTYFLKALYQLQKNSPHELAFSKDDIFKKIKQIFPIDSKKDLDRDFNQLFTENLNPIELKFCTRLHENGMEKFMAQPGVGFDDANSIFDLQVPLEKAVKSYFDKYYPDAYEDYCSLYETNNFLSMFSESVLPTESVVVEPTDNNEYENYQPLLPKFNVYSTHRNNSTTVHLDNRKSLTPQSYATSNSPIVLGAVLKAICEYVLVSSTNLYSYQDLLSRILPNYSFNDEEKRQAIFTIIQLHGELLKLDYCYENLAHGISLQNVDIVPKYSLRPDKKFDLHLHDEVTKSLSSLHDTVVSLINERKISETNSQRPWDTVFITYEHVENKGKDFIKLNQKDLNTIMMTVCYTLVRQQQLHKNTFSVREVLRTIDKSFEHFHHFPIFSSLYKEMIKKILGCAYFVPINHEYKYLKANKHKKLCTEEFNEGYDADAAFKTILESTNAVKQDRVEVGQTLLGLYIHCLCANTVHLQKEDVKKILDKHDERLSLKSEKILKFLCRLELLTECENSFFLKFSSKGRQNLANLDSSLITYHSLLEELNRKFQVAFIASKSGNESRGVSSQFNNPIFSETNNKRKAEDQLSQLPSKNVSRPLNQTYDNFDKNEQDNNNFEEGRVLEL